MVNGILQASERFANFLETSLMAKEGDFTEQLIKELTQQASLEELMPLLLEVFYKKISIDETSLRGSQEEVTLYIRQRLRIIEEGITGYLRQHINHDVVKQKFQELLERIEEIQLHDICAIHIKDHIRYIKDHYKLSY